MSMKVPEAIGSQAVTEANIQATVLRCNCGDATTHIPNPCPTPRVEPLGTIS